MAKKVIIVGGGPAGLFCAYLLLKKNYQVDLYDHSSGLAKKFLIAGNGGLNLTHSEDLKPFSQKYIGNENLFYELINEFSPSDLRGFCDDLGVETFIGTSGRVFPKKLKAGEILLKWTKILKENSNFNLYLKHSLIDMDSNKTLSFSSAAGEVKTQADTVILATGGASWKKTGSDGKWCEIIQSLGIEIEDFRAMNCGFEVSWSEHLKKRVERSHLKNIELSILGHKSRGEAMITPYGIEGGVVYALSKFIQDKIQDEGSASVNIDLKPDLSDQEIEAKLQKRKLKDSLSNHLRKSLKLDKASIALLYENSLNITAKNIKCLPIKLERPRPIDEAISTSGGVKFSELTKNFESKAVPGLYFAGEMLDFDAPTGGYLLQGCFSTASRVVKGLK
ncbi:MAG: aminoacetone oxidase family FAD-binding enzyme [Halobacteriovoraceae bacterium]|nr:aminoacetone oxidase family FAD-binding enzyme [Halobacteriovoraceae bacterium]|tara:strand:+ start:21798 stop:22973 length:1176 start_codon:yes stop_codon:yes gene_type:complete